MVPAVLGPVAPVAYGQDQPRRTDPAVERGASAQDPAPGRDTVEPARRDEILPSGWATSEDVAWTTTGDTTGFHVLAATARSGYTWQTVATLTEPGFDADQWVGNACLTGSGRRLVVVYGPRTFTNREELFDRGGFTAVVDLTTGAVTKLPVQSSLAYFSPGCGPGETAVVTQLSTERAETRLTQIDAANPRVDRMMTVAGEVTSAVPTANGIVAARGHQVVQVNDEGRVTPLAASTGVPFHIQADADGGAVFMDRAGDQVRVRRVANRPGSTPATLVTGRLGELGVTSGAGGRVFLVGSGRQEGELPAGVTVLDVPRSAVPSSHGQLVLTEVDWNKRAPDVGLPIATVPVRIAATVPATGKRVDFTVHPVLGGIEATAGSAPHPKLAVSGEPGVQASATGSPTDPVEEERTCSVPRNDPRSQVYQPTPRQVEWAADQAVTGSLTFTREANWKQSGLPAYSPQGWFPPIPLEGGGRVPAQIMLGILAQESNLWQASRMALPGVTGNPLIGNYYGRPVTNSTSEDDWDIHWDKADCGYGVSQVTDGMRRAGATRPGETALEPEKQRAVALDYAANIAAGLRILQEKWNQTRRAGLIINNGDPSKIENWFFAVWAYNSGFHPDQGDGSPWGMGWFNNPINPRYPADRKPFLEYTYDDARTPQKWPYPEKVLGWAGHPLEALEAPGTPVAGFRAAWWNTVQHRITVKPPLAMFCDPSNDCIPGREFVPDDPDVVGEPAGPCAHKNAQGLYDLRCWYHEPATWKPDCNYSCGNELLRFDPGYPAQPDGTSYPPVCTRNGLPSNAVIVDDVPDSVPSVRPGCENRPATTGRFELSFAADASGHYPSKVDFHQIGSGFNGHFWVAHTRKDTSDLAKMHVTGTWRPDLPGNGWYRVLVHIPSHGAHTQQATYVIHTGSATKKRVIPQRRLRNEWVNLGVFHAGQWGEVPQIDSGFLDENTTLVMLSIGGNDSRFGDVMTACMNVDWCDSSGFVLDSDPEPLVTYEPKLMREKVRPSIKQTLVAIHQRAPNARIVLVGYPALLSDSDFCLLTLTRQETEMLNDFAGVLAGEMKAVAAEVGNETGATVDFVDPRPEFAGHAVCDPEPWITDVVLGPQSPGEPSLPDTLVSQESFHPTVTGTSAYARAVERVIRPEN